MSKKAILFVCSISFIILAMTAGLLIYFLQKDDGSAGPTTPEIFTEVEIGDISIKQNAANISSITAKFKSFLSTEFETLKTESGDEDLSIENPNDKLLFSGNGLVLNAENPYIIFQFEIKNNGDNNIAAMVDFQTEQDLINSLDFSYSHNGEDFSYIAYGEKANSGVSILAGESEKYYVKISPKKESFINSFEGTFDWTLVEIDNAHNVRIGTNSYATIFDAYTAAQYGDIISIINNIETNEGLLIEKKLYIYADRDLTWTTNSIQGIVIGNCLLHDNMTVTSYDLWLGCDNGNRLTLKSNGEHNAIFMGSSSLYLAADIVCGTYNITTECVGVRKVAASDVSHFQHRNTLTLYGGTISGFYYGVLDATKETSHHTYGWGSIYDCVVGIYAEVGIYTESVGGAKITLGLDSDNAFYIYSCDDHGIYCKGKVTLGTFGGGKYEYITASSKLIINNLVLGEDEFGNKLKGNSALTGCAMTLIDMGASIEGRLICKDYSATPIYLTGKSYMGASGDSYIELKNNKGHAGGAIFSNATQTIDLRNAIISGNEAVANGGAIYVESTTLIIDDSIIEDNKAGDIGGAILALNGHINISGGIVKGNTSANGGGAIYSKNSEMNLYDTEIFDNTTQGDGGAMFLAGTGANLIVGEGTNIYDNTAKTRGGAIRIFEEATMEMQAGKIHGNSVNNPAAKASGGGVYVNSGAIFNMLGGEIYDNIATGLTSYGGNVYVSGEYSDEYTSVEAGIFYFEDGLIYGDGTTSQAMNGGGIANLGLCIMVLGEIRDCVADYGSGVYNIGTLSAMETKISSTTTTESIGKSIVNIGTLYFGPITLEGDNMDIVIACTEFNNEITSYAIVNVFTPLINQDENEMQYKLTFAQYDSDTKQITLTNDFVSYYINNSLPIITYSDYDGEPFEANVDNFIADNFDFVLSNDGYGLNILVA